MRMALGIDFSCIFVDLRRQVGAKLALKIDKESIQKGIKHMMRKKGHLGPLEFVKIRPGSELRPKQGPKRPPVSHTRPPLGKDFSDWKSGNLYNPQNTPAWRGGSNAQQSCVPATALTFNFLPSDVGNLSKNPQQFDATSSKIHQKSIKNH